MANTEKEFEAKWKNPMQKPFISKVVVNIGIGSAGADELKKARRVLIDLTGRKPSTTKAKKNIKEWSIRKNQAIGARVTLRKKDAEEFLKKALVIFDNRILRSAFDQKGNFSFGVDEHIKFPGIKYDPDLGIFGFNVSCKVERPGHRIKYRKKNRRKVGEHHYVSKLEAMYFMEKFLNVEIVDVMEQRFY
ncbi:MAG: 50S ribosomal protein L5 [Promethearchaeota archaeon]